MLCAVFNERGAECFVPGIVQTIHVLPNNDYSYELLYFNGQTGINRSYQLVKISKTNYGKIVENILQKMCIRK